MFEILESHPQAAGVFESWLFHETLGLGGLFSPLHWDPEITGQHEREIGRPLGLKPLLERAELREDVRALASRWLAKALGPGDRYLIEKSPVHLHFASVLAEVFPSARFVEVVRDGRDAAVSALSASRAWNPSLVREGRPASVRDVARDWRVSIDAGERDGAAYSDRWLRIRFEDLRRDFASTIARTLAFCDMTLDGDLVERMRAATDLAKHKTGESQFRRGGRVGDWRSRFTLRDARAFDRVAGDTLVALGYEQDRDWWRAAIAPRFVRARRG
jgi:Sulfotransferase family